MEEIKEVTQGGNEENESEKEDLKEDKELTPNEDNNEDNQFEESEGTILCENEFDDTNNIQIYLENEFNEIIETNPKEDIDNYIDNMKNKFNKAKMMRINTVSKNINNENSDLTVIKNPTNNPNNIILEDMCNLFKIDFNFI